jgi:cellulose synthase/poly-beta-1,6-N-acetylglucosamine synthase-like glycosyltransferase
MKKKQLSVIVPTWNEVESLPTLIKRINACLTQCGWKYEVIIIDDHSSDKTVAVAKHLQRRFPILVHHKVGKRGKAFSLLEGFKQARYQNIAMIDADLQYPPEALVPMASLLLHNEADVVVAERDNNRLSYLRRIASRTFRYIFGTLLHGMKEDVQSGLKVFRKEILNGISLNPSPWTFDLEFLLKAKNAAYRVSSYPIIFEPRAYGSSKLNLLRASLEIGWSALFHKYISLDVSHFSKLKRLQKGEGFHFRGREFIHHGRVPTHQSAFVSTTAEQTLMLVMIATAVLLSLSVDWRLTVTGIVVALTALYFFDLLYHFFVITRSFTNNSEVSVSTTDLKDRDSRSWPHYTILCPLYKEWQVVPQFVEAVSAIEYPKDRLQVLLLLEEDDQETIVHVERMRLPKYFDVSIVPDSQPKTKPKACNYGLHQTNGEFVVIFDAEDVPDPLQLKRAVLAFEQSPPELVCVQAKLNFYNSTQNVLTRLFTAEYSLWFDLVLTGLQSMNAPIPLGGTSNHFKTAQLRGLGGWDSFNVTEDCDLGVRLSRQGFQTALMKSDTLEEANSDVFNWFRQRTRWIKGYLQTYLVHMRQPDQMLQEKDSEHFSAFQLLIGGKVFLALVNPIMWILTILYFTARSEFGPLIEQFFPGPVLYLGVISLVFGNFLYLYYYMIGCARRKQYSLIKYAFLVPLYWLYMSIAAWVAVIELVYRPHYWSKTKHGLHLSENMNISSAQLSEQFIATATSQAPAKVLLEVDRQ